MTKDKALHFNIQFDDLDIMKQEEIIAELTPSLQAAAEAEGREFLKKEWHDPKPQTWQEAYCREYAIEYILWQTEVEVDKKVVTPAFIWETWQEQHVAELARKKAEAAFNLTEIEVAL